MPNAERRAMQDPVDQPDPGRLLGGWRLAQADPGLALAPGTRLEFASGARLRYTVMIADRPHVVDLIYRVEGDHLHFAVPAAAHEQTAHVTFGPGDVLVFDFGGPRAIFIREL
ncbi:MAG: hypothetical protein U0163_13995 [Gemmatimonadaceae bacterium]